MNEDTELEEILEDMAQTIARNLIEGTRTNAHTIARIQSLITQRVQEAQTNKFPLVTLRMLSEADPKPANNQWFKVGPPGIYAYEITWVEHREAITNNNGSELRNSTDAK